MDNISAVFILQLLLGTCRLSLLQNISVDLRSVQPGENTTLHCSISADYEVSWYHQSSEEMKLLMSAGKANTNRHYYLSFNVDEGHYEGVENSSSVSLVIIGVKETDLGLYYCGGRNRSSVLQFGKAIRLIFTDSEADQTHDKNQADEPSPDSADLRHDWIMNLSLMCVCSASVLMNIICMSVFCYRGQGKSFSPHICLNNINSAFSVEKDLQELQYASPVYNRHLREADEENSASASDCVTYATVSRPSGCSPA